MPIGVRQARKSAPYGSAAMLAQQTMALHTELQRPKAFVNLSGDLRLPVLNVPSALICGSESVRMASQRGACLPIPDVTKAEDRIAHFPKASAEPCSLVIGCPKYRSRRNRSYASEMGDAILGLGDIRGWASTRRAGSAPSANVSDPQIQGRGHV